MDCCGGHSDNHTTKTNSQEKKVPWLSITLILLIIGLLVFSVLK